MELSFSTDVAVALANGAASFAEVLGISDDCLLQLGGYAHKLIEHNHDLEAAALFDGLVTLDPGVAYFHLGLGTALSNLGRSGAAFAAFERAKSLDPGEVTPYVCEAQLYIQAEQRDEARTLLEFARQLDQNQHHPMSPLAAELWMAHLS